MGALHRLLEELSNVIARLSEDVGRGVPIVVEGRSDVEALRALGVNGCFVIARQNGRTVADMVLELANKADEVIILTDFDAAGQEQAMSWARELESLGLRANLSYWRYLKGLVGSFAKDIEGLPSLIETLIKKAGHRVG